MAKMIELEFPEAGISVRATLNEAEEPEMCERLWGVLESPIRMANCHTLSTGDFFDARMRPPKHPVKIGFQAANISRIKRLYSEMEAGMVLFSGIEMGLVYGDHITEPLVASGTYVAHVLKEDLEKFYKAGKFVWETMAYKHELTTTVARRVV